MSRVWVAIKRSWKFFGAICGVIVFFVCVFMGWRIFSTVSPKAIDKLSINDKLVSAYAEQDAKGESLYMFKQNQDTLTRAEYNAGYFAIPDYVFIPSANQLQLVFRYNKSTLNAVALDKKFKEPLARDGDYFDVNIVLYLDMTPNNPDDNENPNSSNVQKVRCYGKVTAKEQTTLYNFYRYVFDFDEVEGDREINLNKLISNNELIAIHAQFFYNKNAEYNKDAQHDFELEFGYKDKNGHANACTVKNCIEHSEIKAHTPNIDAPTEEQAQVCTDCGYEIAPKLGHTHEPSTNWSYNNTHHWHTCSGCGSRLDEAPHSYASDSVVACDCGYEVTPYGALLLYDPAMKKIKVNLSSAEKSALKQ